MGAADAPRRGNDPVSRQTEPTFGPVTSTAAAASSPTTTPSEPRLRTTEPTFGTPPLARDDREPHFVIGDTHDDTRDDTHDNPRDHLRDNTRNHLRNDDADDIPHTSPAATPDAPHPSSPGFMGTPDDAEPSPWRWVWIVLAVVAVLALLGQSIWLYRTELATWFPAMRPALEKACVQLDCTVSYPRDPRQLTVESSALETWSPEAAAGADGATGAAATGTGASTGTGTSDTTAIAPSAQTGTPAAASSATPGVRHLALRVTLRNRAKHPQPWPALELSLTDFSETVVSRRVLLPSTYLPPQQLADPIPAGQERSLRIPIDTTEARASGYRVAAFFP